MATVGVEEQQLLIGGSWVSAEAGRTFERADPFTGEAVTVAAAAGRADARRAVEAAHAAFPAWAATPPARRRELLNAAADLLAERAQEIAATVTEETGGTFGWGMFNVMLAGNMLRAAAGQAYSGTGELIPSDVPGATSTAVRQPVGVVVGIAPWNAPVILGTRAVATPLAYGNTVVLKASEQCPRVHAHIVRALADAGLPDGVINLLTNDPADAADVVEELIAHPLARRINFTGSSAVGRIIAEKSATHFKRTLLELGGKAPFVVLDDADLEEAANAASFGAFMHSGQICMSTERIIADSSVVDDFSAKLAERASKLVVGDPRDQSTQIGPVIGEGARDRIMGLIEDARSKGATVLAGGEADGLLIQPTVLGGVTPEMRIYREESFGPVVAIITVDGVEQAVEVANDSDYGLSGAVFGADTHRAREVAGRLETGICHVNSSTVQDEPQMPFGGVKHSGWGRFGGSAALDEFTELRWISIQDGSRHYPI
jgi:acyl-CoA reductase-like NAD-dependent aldehyde dehydrogenase